MDTSAVITFQQTVLDYYRLHGRHDLPWRIPESDGSFDPYKIMVSEVMLQQTQVGRAIPKYQQFLKLFPDAATLASASQSEVLSAWSGLGYNRRAKFLHQAAQAITIQYQGQFPQDQTELTKLPGIGVNTAGAILAYSFNSPVVFLETNIRTVYIHHFFNDKTNVADAKIKDVVGQTLDTTQPRVWYWALMDYGSFLKKSIGNANQRSATYTRQSSFEGSQRQIRGQVIKLLTTKTHTLHELQSVIADTRLEAVLADLKDENLIRYHDNRYQL